MALNMQFLWKKIRKMQTLCIVILMFYTLNTKGLGYELFVKFFGVAV